MNTPPKRLGDLPLGTHFMTTITKKYGVIIAQACGSSGIEVDFGGPAKAKHEVLSPNVIVIPLPSLAVRE